MASAAGKKVAVVAVGCGCLNETLSLYELTPFAFMLQVVVGSCWSVSYRCCSLIVAGRGTEKIIISHKRR